MLVGLIINIGLCGVLLYFVVKIWKDGRVVTTTSGEPFFYNPLATPETGFGVPEPDDKVVLSEDERDERRYLIENNLLDEDDE